MKSERFMKLIGLLLATAFWFAAPPISLSRDLSPTEMIENGLPARKGIKNASKPDFLNAVCSAVRKNRQAGGAITSAAIAARGELAGEIVGMVLRCASKLDCDYVETIVAAAVTARAVASPAISDAAISTASTCAETIQAAVRTAAPAGEVPPAEDKPVAQEKFDPHEPLRLVCENGGHRTVRASELEEFLRTHPGSFAGPCPPTPSPSPPNPSPAPKD
ncbi:MAG: hypothetical protein ABIU29_10150 [Chthoniobacterales bacterium]